MFDYDSVPLAVGDRVVARPNKDGVPAGSRGVIAGAAGKGGVARIKFVVDGMPWLRVVSTSIVRKAAIQSS